MNGFQKIIKKSLQKSKKIRSGQKEHGIKSFYKKAKKIAKKTVNSDIAKMAISQRLAYAPKLYDMGNSKIGNKKVKNLLQSKKAKNHSNKGLDKAYLKL